MSEATVGLVLSLAALASALAAYLQYRLHLGDCHARVSTLSGRTDGLEDRLAEIDRALAHALTELAALRAENARLRHLLGGLAPPPESQAP